MKKFKLLGTILAFFAFLFMPIAYAHEIDVNNKISFSVNSANEMWSKSKITVPESWKVTEVSYQYIEITDEVFKSYSSISEQEAKYDAENKPGDNATDKEKKDYADAINEYEASKEALLPAYVEANWKVTEDHTTPLDTTKYEAETHFVLWAKVVYEEDNITKTAYNDLVLTYTPSTTGEENVPNARTGDNIVLFAVGAALVAGVMVISYRKVNA